MRFFSRLLTIAALVLANLVLLAQTQKAPAGIIQGIVQSGGTPLPGVAVTATNTATSEKIATSTDLNGQYQFKVSAAGTYSVATSMAAFAAATKEASVSVGSTPQRLDFDLTLASRTQQAASQPRQTVGFRGRGAQQLQVQQTAAPEAAQEGAPDAQSELTADLPADVPAVPGFAQDAPTESVAILGNTAESTFGNNFNFDRDQIQQFIDQQFGFPPGGPGGPGGQGGGPDGQGGPGGQGGGRGGQGGFQGGPGGPGGGRGGQGGPGGFQGARGGGGGGGGRGGNRGGGGGGRGFAVGRGGRGFGATAPRGNLSYQLADSGLDAAPYSLTGQAVTKPEYTQNRFSATLGGPLVIPKVVKTTTTNYTVSYNGGRSRNPVDILSTVPSIAERNGDFSQTTVRNGVNAGNPVQLFDPNTHAPIANNIFPQSMLNPAAVSLLKFYPEPNLPGAVQNFHYATATTSNQNSVNIRMNHNFANPQQQQQGRGGRAGFQQGGRGGGGRGGGRGRGSAINFGLSITSNKNVLNSSFPTIAGNSRQTGLQTQFGYVRSFGRLTNQINVSYNRNRNTRANLFGFQQDIEGALGITGVSTNPFDWGAPNLSFTNFTGLNDIQSSLNLTQNFQVGENMNWNHNRHNFRLGTDFRLARTNTHSTQNARGTFTFTGARTAAVVQGVPVQGTGFDLADFLLGLPQSTSLQYGDLTYKFRGSSYDVYFQDDWRATANLTFNLGVRYDYASPYTEANNKIVNLDAAPGFVAVVPVLPGATGPYSGEFPRSLVKPDRNNIAPRIGIAWRAIRGTVIRAGYGVTYNGAAYAQIASQLSNQPPFSVAQTNIYSAALPLTLQNGFPPLTTVVSNTYGINPDYRIGYAQQWNLDLQQDLRKLGMQLNLDYTGTKGTRLDVIEAPNRTATGLRIPGVQPFNWETSDANSILHSGSIRLRRRLGRGISLGGTYQFSKSIDNASSVSGGGGGGTLAQDAFNLAAERGLSSFDQPHRLNLDYNFELPFGTGKRFFSEPSLWKTMFGDWQFNGTWNVTSATPSTARVLGSFTDVNRGSNGSLRANATGLPVGVGDPTVAQWFNTAAFTVPPAGQFGNVGRNTIRGPLQRSGNLSVRKTFRFADGRSVDVSAQSTNFLNMPQFTRIDTTVNSPSFGRVTNAGQMRRIQLQARFNF